MAFMTGDAWQDANTLYDREEEYENRLPTCGGCGEKITGEYLYDVDDELFCEECFNERYRKNVEDYIGGEDA